MGDQTAAGNGPDETGGEVRPTLAAELQRERDVLETIMENTRAHLAYLDRDLRFIRVNSAYARGSGHAKDELIGRLHFELFPHEENEGIFRQVRDTGRAVEFHARPFVFAGHPERGTSYWDWTLTPVKDPVGRVQGLVLSLVDVTEQVQAAQERERLLHQVQEINEQLVTAALRETRLKERYEQQAEQMSALLRSMKSAVTVLDGRGNILLQNEAARQLTGFSGEDTRPTEGYPGTQLLSVDGGPLPPERWPVPRLLRGDSFAEEEYVVVQADGTERRVVSSGSGLLDGSGRVVAAIVVTRDVTELRELEKARENLVHIVSHDLRTPLTAISGYAQLLRQSLIKEGAPERQIKSVDSILVGARRMNSMIQDLVDSARLESGQLILDKEPVALAFFLHDLLERSEVAIDTERVEVQSGPEVPPVLADASRLERIMINLLSNALKYSDPDSRVLVRAERGDGYVTVSVQDHGPGIDLQDLPRIFDRFFRSRGGRKTEGLGLGLYITRMMVEAHGGHIWVESESGTGSTFYFTLPMA